MMKAKSPISFLFLVLAFACFLHSCKTTASVEDGQTAYRLKQYAVAIEMLKEEIKREGDQALKAKMAYHIGDSYNKIQRFKDSRDWLEKSVGYQLDNDNLRALAYAEKRSENYPAAIKRFKQLEKRIGRNALISREINICEQSSRYLEEQNDFYKTVVEPLAFNDVSADYSPQIFNDSYIVFSSDRSESKGDEVYKWSGQDFSDLFMVNKNGGGLTSFNASINTASNEGAACFTKDFRKMYFTRCYTELTENESEPAGDVFCKIMVSELEDDKWQIPTALAFQVDGVNYGHPALIENDSILLFTAEDINGANGYDIYYTVLGDAGWSTPLAMPSSINTQGDEKFPVADGDTLYFSSDYLPGLGGLDIFKTYLINNESWAPPVNVKAPINSGADDFGLTVDRSRSNSSSILEEGYFTSNRIPGNRDDIFRYQRIRKEKVKEDTLDVVPELKKDFNIYLAIKTVEVVHEIKGDPTSAIIDKIPLPNVDVTLVVAMDTSDFRTDGDARLIESVRIDKQYHLLATKSDYFSARATVSTIDVQPEPDENAVTINVELALDPIVYDQEITLADIYYDFDKWNIREDARPSLDKLSDILNENAKLSIQLSSHTDCRGNNAFNQNLSQKRAESATNYLVKKGVSLSRITPVGYGESLPIADCDCDDCSEDEHQANRRTTFKILR